MKRECETCIKRKTPYCPTSIDCMATDDMPYYQNIIMLLEENQELKKQLEEYQEEVCILDMRTDENIKYKNQQKEFINYLEDEIKKLSKKWGNKLTETGYLDIAMTVRAYRIILQKYKEIIGDDK